MKKCFLLFLIAIFAVSCSKKVEVKGKILGGSPLERIEFIEGSGVATLPLVNLGFDKNGNFSGSFEAPKNGMYVINYGGKQNMVYLKGGQTLEISANGMEFPINFKVLGDAKNNNDFVQETQKFLQQYAAKVNMQQIMSKDESAFLKEAQKISDDLQKNAESFASKYHADSEVLQWKKDELKASILGLLTQYELNHAQVINNPSFKVSKNFRDFQKKLEEDNDRLVENHPAYRNYLLGKISQDYQKFASTQPQNPMTSTSQTFSKYLETRKDFSQITKDYLFAYVLAQSDLHPGLTKEQEDKITKLIDSNIKNSTIKEDLKKLQFVIDGFNTGSALPDVSLSKQDGSSYKFSDLKGKPTLLMFYASWNPYISQSTVPVLKEVVNFYKSKVNFVFVNLDDDKNQFIKTSAAMLKGISGTNVYAEGGLNSDAAKKFGLYAFKLPGFLLVNKDGKVEGKYFRNLGDPEMVSALDKVSGLHAPAVQPQATLRNDLLAPQPAPAPQSQPAPSTK